MADSDGDEDILWGGSSAAVAADRQSTLDQRRAVYAGVVQDDDGESSDEERMEDATAARRSNVIRAEDFLGPHGMGAMAGAGPAGASGSSGAAAEARPQAVTGASVLSDDGEEEDEEDEDDDEELEDEDELGGDADQRFQAMLERLQREGTGGDNADSEDLLSQILKKGANSWKTGARDRQCTGGTSADDDEEDEHAGSGAHGAVADDQVDYQIYVDALCEGDASADSSIALTKLAAVRAAILAFVAPTTADYVWQHQGLQLQVCAPHVHSAGAASVAGASTTAASASSSAASAASSTSKRKAAAATAHASSHSRLLPHLHGCSYFGDCVSDEWLLVYLLLTLTADSKFADLSICMADADGAFLAIETAEHLPEWLQRPEAAANRVWIRRGALHLIPPPQNPAQLATLPVRPTVEQALQILRTQAVPTAASSAVQQALLQKLAPFFAAASSGSAFTLLSPSLSAAHCARVSLPLPLALLLRRHGDQLLAEWGQAFLARDGLDMQRGNKMERVLGPAKRQAVKAQDIAVSSTADKRADMQVDSTGEAAAAQSSPAPARGGSSVPFVFVRVRFTHALYAALVSARWSAPRVFAGPHASLLSSQGLSGPVVAHALDLGSKLATGAEMWFANRRAELNRASNKARLARSKLREAHPDVRRRDEAAELARKVKAAELLSASAVEALLSAANPSLVSSWRDFLAEVRSRGVATTLALQWGWDLAAGDATSASHPAFWRVVLAHFLASRFQPHQCVDLERNDELLRDPLLLPLFDPAEWAPEQASQHGLQRRVESCINLPHEARLLEDMEQLCDACATSTAAPESLPSELSAVADALLFASFASLPRDDSDEWMSLAPADLEAMLAKAQAEFGGADGPAAAGGNDIVQAVRQFVEHGKSELATGVEAPPAKPHSSSKSSKSVSFAGAAAPGAAKAPSTAAFPPVQVDNNELMRLLASVQAEMQHAAPAASTALSGAPVQAKPAATVATVATIEDVTREQDEPMLTDATTKSASSARSVRFADDVNELADDEDGQHHPPPTRETTRPPVNDAYANVFGAGSTTGDGAPLPWTPEAMAQQQAQSEETPAAKQQPQSATQTAQQAHSAAGATAPQTPAQQPQQAPAAMRDYMNAMDDELQRAGLQSDFVREGVVQGAGGKPAVATTAAGASGQGAVHVDANLLSNLLRSHEAEHAQGSASHAGPVTALLASLGVPLPTVADRTGAQQ